MKEQLIAKIMKNATFLSNLLREDVRKQKELGHLECAQQSQQLADDIQTYYNQYVSKQYTLRKMTFDDVLNETSLGNLKYVTSGSIDQLHEYAQKNSYTWRNSPKYLFGGFYYKKPLNENEHGECLLIY